MRYATGVLLSVMLLLLLYGSVQAQRFPSIPTIPAADSLFQRGLNLYRAGNYREAARLFDQAAHAFPLHRHTTAALIMEGKALLGTGDYAGAACSFQELINRFPESRYATEAQRLLRIAEEYERRARELPLKLTRVGILLPLHPADIPFTQALFNGIYLATERYNAQAPNRPVQLIFRDSGQTPEQSKTAAQMLINQGAQIIIGPLYSEKALVAAEAAEAARIPLLVPLATQETLTRGKRYTFQVNPPLSIHARTMAQVAYRDFGVKQLAILADSGTVGASMASWFEETYSRLGGRVYFRKLLTAPHQWFALSSVVSSDSIRTAGTLYLPITGPQAPTIINGLLHSLVRMLVTPHILGSPSWHNLPDKKRLSQFSTAYTYPSWVDRTRTAVRQFQERYRKRYARQPDRRGLTYIGYDVATFLYRVLEPLPLTGELTSAIRSSAPYEGLALRIDFQQTPVNHGLFVLGYREGRIVRIR